MQYFQSLGTTYNTDCISYIQEPAWAGSTQAAMDWSMQVFGTNDLWNDNYATDSPTNDGCYNECSECKDCNTAAIVCGITIPLVSIIIGLLGYIYMLKPPKEAMANRENDGVDL